jgi:hypothetical protein
VLCVLCCGYMTAATGSCSCSCSTLGIFPLVWAAGGRHC